MLVGLCSEDGEERFPWEEIREALEIGHRPTLDALSPADPATLAFLAARSEDRKGLDPHDISASAGEKEARQLWLERNFDFFAPPSALISGAMGTIRHGTCLMGHKDFLTEQRFRDEIGSGQIDTFHIPTGTLSDLKTVGWYKLKMILTKGLMEEGKGYALQVNRQRILLEKNTEFKVRRQILMVIPPDLKGRVKAEAEALGVKVMKQIEVPVMDDFMVQSHYQGLRDGLLEAEETGDAPLCSDKATWGGKKCQGGFCQAAPVCKALETAKGRTHPWL